MKANSPDHPRGWPGLFVPSMGRGETTYATIRMIDLLLRRPHINDVSPPKNLKPKPVPTDSEWEAGTLDREID
jgi:hypothetical protein